MPRIARVYAEGYPHHITQRENNKEAAFFDDEDRRLYLDVLRRYKDKYEMKILAYCLMGNHVHVLAVPEKETSLARGIGGTNLLYTQYINRKYNRSGRLWQNRFFSSVVEKEPYLWAVMRYIEQNPVRAKEQKTMSGQAQGLIYYALRTISLRFIKKLERILKRDIFPKKGGRPKKKGKA